MLTGQKSGAPLGSIGHVLGFIGGAATEGPRATLIARNILSAGGTAADAAVAAAFMLTVTYPVAASLAGGGRCLVFDGERETVGYFDFPVRPPAGGGTVPIPGLVRGLALLHAEHGRLPWSQLVSPAEQVARFGERVTRAYARVLREPGVMARLSPAARTALAVGPDGQVLDEGAPHVHPELASTLSRIRLAGAGDFYSGLLARSFVDAVDDLGGTVTMDEMRGYRIDTGIPEARPFDAFEVYFDPAHSARMLAVWDKVVERRPALIADGADLSALPAALLSVAPAGLGDGAPNLAGIGATTIAVADREGQSVACSLEVGPPFGSGLYARAVGTLLPAMPTTGSFSEASLAVIGSEKSWRSRGAFGAASGLPGGATASLLETMLPMLADDATAAQAQARARFVPLPGGTGFAVEGTNAAAGAAATELPAEMRQALSGTGRPVTSVERIGRVNIAYCADGIPVDDDELCYFAHDPRGHGLGAGYSF
ncbi:gamma-glutamyltransferase [Marinibaculum pumilum]|uniref:Gamma-glutamyltransferase n=1 Tax=Marinibaculum pumilum TaxID=1766165 RepID=A0ABV7KYS0_9PROT